ncbi:hypothetical protein [Aneurinibacillus danicus]|jgi:hypothetical protein|uniref:Uncharacterized protein n=1 Tax=Aneurinibacillus danicus TaxID=267746 RepID=A0A511VDV1_9BACL|nr:hypothetical protein [Aneurinibacillus danicus]GEN35452.1 hypothetical protein ADA01nite_29120 [Aneurinibacillus danicus]
MRWEKVQEIYPNQFVLLQSLKSHVEADKKYIEEVAIIRPLEDEREATKELLKAKGDRFVYHTSKPSIVMEIIRKPNIRRKAPNESGVH